MSLPSFNHYFFTASADIDALIAPLKQFFGITSFVYQKNFHDGSEIRLSNQPKWVHYFYEKKLYEKSIFEHTPEQYQKDRALWSNLPQHHPILSKAKSFNIDHGITFIEPQSDGCEFFFIGTTPDRPNVMPRYLSHLDLLEQFLSYFRERAAPIIRKANQHRVVIPNKFISTPVLLQQETLDRSAFLRAIRNDHTIPFSPRELDCIKLLLSGYTLKMIAYELQLSYRTVETHVEHIKQKAGSHTKAELVQRLLKMEIF